MAKIVVALGGNALGNSASEQKEAIQKVVPGLVDLVENQICEPVKTGGFR